jgi:hypothetical protein
MPYRRNDPCPCGSGKQYKECCLESRVADFQEHKWQRLARELQERLLVFAEDECFISDSEEAFQLYIDTVSDELFDTEEEPAFVSFVDWFMHDYPLKIANGLNLVQYFAQKKERDLGPMEQELLRNWAGSYISLLCVRAVGEEWILFEDLLVGGEYPVHEFALAQGIGPGSIILGRFIKVGAGYRLSGAALEFTPLLQQEIVQVVNAFHAHWERTNPNGNWFVFLKEEGFRLPGVITTALEGEEADWDSGNTISADADNEWIPSQQLVIQMLEYYYRRWADSRIPSLGNKTPRELSQTAAGKQQLESFLRKLEITGEGIDGDRKIPSDLDFDRIRALLGLRQKESNPCAQFNPRYREVARLLEQNSTNQAWIKNAKRLWSDFYHQAQPQVKKAAAWAAAVTYTMARIFSDGELTQREVADSYQVAPGTISNHFRSIWETLGLKIDDNRYKR